jgi:imidazole glycerol-phosphate synthase subunit HisF
MALATRIIPVLLSKGGTLVKGRGFIHSRVVGHALQAVRIYQGRGVDELLFLDVTATAERRGPDIDLVRQLTAEMFAPLTVGGGVSTLDHFRELLRNGADKVAINTAAVENPAIIARAAEKFGRQAVTVSIDVKDGYVQTHCGTRRTDLRPVEWARECERLGAGEILLTSVDRDGTLAGYDTALIRSVAEAVSIPVVACGGAGTYQHLKKGLDAGAHAVAAGAMFQFTDQTPAGAAEYLHKAGVRVRRKIAA